MQENTKNVAYTKEYIDMLDDSYRRLFVPGCYKSEGRKELGKNLSALTKIYFYDNGNPKNPYKLQGSETVISRDGVEIYSYKTLDEVDRECWVFSHQNGHEYFLFTRDLYGYSVLDLATMQDYHFYPAGSFPTGETFIWCDVHYNPINNIMAVGGCYWACPYVVVLVDFTNPMQDNPQSEESEAYMEFEKWDGTDLILRDYRQTSTKIEPITFTEDEYMKWFTKV